VGARLARTLLSPRHAGGRGHRHTIDDPGPRAEADQAPRAGRPAGRRDGVRSSRRPAAGALPQGKLRDEADEAFDGVFHLASAVSGECEADFELGLRSNLDSTRALLDACATA
jgi:nucleoside-diphosphate-sugar epimerase